MFDPRTDIPQTGEEAAKVIAYGERDRQRGAVPVFHNPTTLLGRIGGFVGIGIILGVVVGALRGADSHNILLSALEGIAGGAAIGAVCGVIWHLVMVTFGGVARVLDRPVLRDVIKGAIFGAIAGAVLAFFNGQVKDPAPTMILIAVLGAGIGGVLGLINLGRRAASSPKAPIPPPWEKNRRA